MPETLQSASTLPIYTWPSMVDLLKPPVRVPFPFTDMQEPHSGRVLPQLTLAPKEWGFWCKPVAPWPSSLHSHQRDISWCSSKATDPISLTYLHQDRMHRLEKSIVLHWLKAKPGWLPYVSCLLGLFWTAKGRWDESYLKFVKQFSKIYYKTRNKYNIYYSVFTHLHIKKTNQRPLLVIESGDL